MGSFWEWFPPLWVGVFFTTIGLFKIYGLIKGIEGGAEKPFFTRLRAAKCPKIRCNIPYYHIILTFLFLAIGLVGIAGFLKTLF